MNRIEFRPKYKEVIDIIHKAGGKAFLAHPFEYKFEDTISFINDLRKEKELDGIECFHPSAMTEMAIKWVMSLVMVITASMMVAQMTVSFITIADRV